MHEHDAIIVTGASSGIGRATTLALARRGWLIFGGIRAAIDGSALVTSAGAVGVGALVQPLRLDVTDGGSIARAAAQVAETLTRRGARLVGLVNNAGVGLAGPVEELPLDRLRAALETNTIGAVATSQAFLPLLRAGRGRIVNVSSMSGGVAAPYLGGYAASKFALEALSNSLRVELRPWGMAVVLIEPGPVATPIWAKGEAAALDDRVASRDASPYAPYLPRAGAVIRRAAARGIPPGEVAAIIVLALSTPRPRARYVLTRNRPAFEVFARLVPDRLRDALLARAYR